VQPKIAGDFRLETRPAPPVYRPQAATTNLQSKQTPGKTPRITPSKTATLSRSATSTGKPSAGSVQDRVAQPRLASPAHAGVVQCRYKLKGDQTEEDLLNRMAEIDKAQDKPLGRMQLTTCLKILQNSAFYHGTIDVGNDQLVGLLYFQAVKVNRRFSDPWEKLSQDLDELGYKLKDLETRINLWGEEFDLGIFNLAIIGAGSAAAYYIDTLGTAYDHSGTLLIGGDDPWSGRRGQGIDFVNHATQQINYPSEGVPDYSETFVKRTEFAERTKTIIEEAIPKKHRFKGAVLSISREESGKNLFVIRWRDTTSGKERTQRAKKVVVATGAGPHSKTTATQENVPLVKERVMDMDKFIRDVVPAYKLNPGNVVSHDGTPVVVVQGPNAAIDAVAAASIGRWTVYWVIRSTLPQYLKGTRYSLGTIPLYKTVHKESGVDIKKQGERLVVTLIKAQKCKLVNHQYTQPKEKDWGAEETINLTADYFVYGIGQEIGYQGEQPAAGHFLDKSIRDNLEFITNQNKRYLEDDTAVGLKLKGSGSDSGLEVIGGSAKALATAKKLETGKLDKVTTHLSDDIIAYEQLGGIRSAMYGLNEILPLDIGSKVDFGHADPTSLRAHFAIKYPNLEESDATRIIRSILDYRRKGHHPHGYTKWWQDHWQGELEFWNKIGGIRQGRF
jgi:hypothetical protein